MKHNNGSIAFPFWREVSFFDDTERAALAWAEAITHVSETGAPQHLFDALQAHYSEVQIVDLTLIISQMNAWNRMAISFGHKPDAKADPAKFWEMLAGAVIRPALEQDQFSVLKPPKGRHTLRCD